MNAQQLTQAQQELLIFINHTDGPEIAIALRRVFNMALFDSSFQLTPAQKDDLFLLEKLISITAKI